MNSTVVLFAILFLSFTQSLFAQEASLSGRWKGEITNVSVIKAHFQAKSKGYKGEVSIAGHSLPLHEIHVTKEDSVFFYFSSGNGRGRFKGTFKNDSLIAGTFYQAGYNFRFKLQRHDRSQLSTKPRNKTKPYNSKDIIIKNDSIKIGGTLTWPNQRTNQLVILISGSGPQKRDDETNFGFKIFGKMADYFTKHNIATYRYDDRGTGDSTGNYFQTILPIFASDLEAIIRFFSKSSDYQFDNITLLGHSQGGIIAGKVAAQDSLVDKLILMASSSITLNRVLRYQIERFYRQVGFQKRQVKKMLKAYDNLSKAIDNKENIQKEEKTYKSLFAKMFKDLPDSIKNRSQNPIKINSAIVKIANLNQSQLFKSYNPQNDLKKLRIPVLALFGRKDQKVLISKNRAPMENALDSANVSYQVNVFNNADHTFRKIELENISTTHPQQFVSGFLQTVCNWIKRTTEDS